MHHSMRFSIVGVAALFLFLGLYAFIAMSTGTLRGQQPTPPVAETAPGEGTPGPGANSMTDPTQWTRPPAPGPSQADRGAFAYWMRCMVCHGDRGQGLASFRAMYPKGDQNCGSPKCHGGPNPPAGFGFPDAPAIIGGGTLARFGTAADLYGFVSTRMPFQAPGILTSDEYWDVVAFLLRQNGTLPDGTKVNPTDARSIPVHPTTWSPGVLAAAGGTLFIVGGFWFFYRRWRHDGRAP